ncbi:hypothetical protein SORBI_3003G268800 [Sorghum bicolor]|uniref:Protein kinase domain-containing protein n=1 Tax=Sorghum bicolor TaxID=4558 RepID=A0A1W0VZ26_SORBI|nr:hypothetical protein SORBI_3003G268800 [Sorghum bicolor]
MEPCTDGRHSTTQQPSFGCVFFRSRPRHGIGPSVLYIRRALHFKQASGKSHKTQNSAEASQPIRTNERRRENRRRKQIQQKQSVSAMAAAAAAVISGGRWTRVRTLGRGASGAVVSLAADDASGALFAVKSAPAGTAAAEHLRREGSILSALRSPHVVPCLGLRAGADGSCQLLLEFAPWGSLADVAARGLGDERAIAAYAADVARGLAYLHARNVVHGDVKARNVVVGADGRAKLADFGCARAVGGSGSGSGAASARPTIIGGTPAFMAPEVARGEEQGPAADVWALGCTVVEIATGRAPWSGVVDDSLPAAVHRIGYTDAVPEVPSWMSAEARDFLTRCCFARNPRDRCTAAQLLEHPFLAGCGGVKAAAAAAAAEWVSPKSTLDAALFWESDDSDDDSDDEGDVSESPAQRIKALACPGSALPDWDSEEGDWIEVLDEQCEAKATNLVPTEDVASEDECQLLQSEVLETEVVDFIDADAEGDDPECSVAVGLPSAAPEILELPNLCDATIPETLF